MAPRETRREPPPSPLMISPLLLQSAWPLLDRRARARIKARLCGRRRVAPTPATLERPPGPSFELSPSGHSPRIEPGRLVRCANSLPGASERAIIFNSSERKTERVRNQSSSRDRPNRSDAKCLLSSRLSLPQEMGVARRLCSVGERECVNLR